MEGRKAAVHVGCNPELDDGFGRESDTSTYDCSGRGFDTTANRRQKDKQHDHCDHRQRRPPAKEHTGEQCTDAEQGAHHGYRQTEEERLMFCDRVVAALARSDCSSRREQKLSERYERAA